VLARPEGAAIAGWSSITLELSAPGRGLRHLLITLDETGRPISAADHVLFAAPAEDSAGRCAIRQESIGGRLEADGTFRGTCWVTTGLEPEEGLEPDWDMRPRAPDDAEIAALKALVAELLGRLDR
jgi:hypothetical protein